jgi:hypothetical protein
MRESASWLSRALALVAAVTATAAAGAASPAPGAPAVIPLSFSSKVPKVRVEMGEATVVVRLDSGAYDSGISLAEQDFVPAHVMVTGTTHWKDARGNELQGRTFVVPELRVGALTVRDVPGTELVFAPDVAPADRDGVLGFVFLRNYIVAIDFSGAQVRLYPADSSRPPDECAQGRASLSILPAGLASTIGTEFGRMRVGWATGATGNMLTAQSMKIDVDADPYGRQVRLRNVSLGSVHIPLLSAQVRDLKIPGLDGVLGDDFFASHHVCLDVKHKTVSVTEASGR